eukprot:TRINITY_DN8498_c0_g1_i3.p1 TRINITY_DN8498_c0_g1~~TRINITY_DN8498_c0_g1_i3.p1  ORF type:complete len:205 (+),score=38.48 TRINITY_DN8498_c0_g1_i3:43-657(+)
MLEEDIEHPVKVLIVGNGAVGKSSMIQRYCKGIFTEAYKKTIGVDFLEKKLQSGNEDLRLMIWDTAGQEEFDSMTKAYYRDAEACVVAFSTIDRASFDAVTSWIKKVEDEVGSIPMVLIQNKIDLIDQAAMSKEEAEALAESVQLKFYRTSVQENYNVDEVLHACMYAWSRIKLRPYFGRGRAGGCGVGIASGCACVMHVPRAR